MMRISMRTTPYFLPVAEREGGFIGVYTETDARGPIGGGLDLHTTRYCVAASGSRCIIKCS